MTTLLTAHELCAALQLRDLSDPGQGPHAMQILLDEVIETLAPTWECAVDVQRRRPLVAIEDNYDRLGYSSGDIIRHVFTR